MRGNEARSPGGGLRERGALLRGLLSGDSARGAPIYVNVDLTHRCNLRCVACRWHSPLLAETLLDRHARLDFPYDLFAPLCEWLGRHGTRTMIFCGAGEPLLHPRFFDFVACARSHRINVIVYSNGTLFTPDRADAVIESGLEECRVSVWSGLGGACDPQDAVLGQQAMDTVLRGLGHLAARRARKSSARPVVEVTFPIGRWNMNRLDELSGLAARGLCDRLRFSVTLDFGRQELSDYCLAPDDTARVVERLHAMSGELDRAGVGHNIAEVVRRYELGERAWERMPCYAGWCSSFFDTEGRVHVCQRSRAPLGRLEEQPFPDIWNGAAYRAFRRQALRAGGLSALQGSYDCRYCPHAVNHRRVHRFYRWVLPLQRLWLHPPGRRHDAAAGAPR